MKTKEYAINLITLNAFSQTEADGDELCLKYKGEKIYPKEGKFFRVEESPLKINTIISLQQLGQWIEIELWEFNYLLPNKKLGVFQLYVDSFREGQQYTADLKIKNNGEARYSLMWQLYESRRLVVMDVISD